jgi:hypothetical protein
MYKAIIKQQSNLFLTHCSKYFSFSMPTIMLRGRSCLPSDWRWQFSQLGQDYSELKRLVCSLYLLTTFYYFLLNTHLHLKFDQGSTFSVIFTFGGISIVKVWRNVGQKQLGQDRILNPLYNFNQADRLPKHYFEI